MQDNIGNNESWKILKNELDDPKNQILYVVADKFSVFAYDILSKELDKLKEFRFLYTSKNHLIEAKNNQKQKEFVINATIENNIYDNDYEICLRNKFNVKDVSKRCSNWILSKKAKFKSISKNNISPFIIIENTSNKTKKCFNGFNNFTESGLQYNKKEIFNPLAKMDDNSCNSYYGLFNFYWNDSNFSIDVSNELCDQLNKGFCENSPHFIYLFTLWNILSSKIEEFSNPDNEPNKKTGYKDTKIWNKLYDFQKDGVNAIIQKINKHGCCILADSVGLGKTFTALGVITYFYKKNKSILVLCPKKLSDNWNQYLGNKVTNLFYEDKVNFDIYCHTDLGRKGRSTINNNELENVNWGNYDLVVIDESHNFRNKSTKKNSRYDFLINKICKQGVETKLLMLSATPVNNTFDDLKNQLELAYAQNEKAFIDSLNLENKNINTIFHEAKIVSENWAKTKTNDYNLLNQQLPYDFKVLLDSVTLARSRKMIQDLYSNKNQFPHRLPLEAYNPPFTNSKGFSTYKDISDNLEKILFACYYPKLFIKLEEKNNYAILFKNRLDKINTLDNFRNLEGSINHSEDDFIASLTKSMRNIIIVNTLKRLESSSYSFLSTLKRIYDYHIELENKINKYWNNEISKEGAYITTNCYTKASNNDALNEDILKNLSFNEDNFDDDKEQDEEIGEQKEVKIFLKDLNLQDFLNFISEDKKQIKKIIDEFEQIKPENDEKLSKLKQIITEKINNPFNENNKKILIFTAFSDTADYLYSQIENWAKEQFNINTALITGNGVNHNIEDKSIPKKDTNNILSRFSPLSKTGDKNKYNGKDFDILIATDCISEGQNLQDCDICINYDIHWNPVRIIQRFGRIDRIGSCNQKIKLVIFWPPSQLDDYINLENRVKSRMAMTDYSSTGDDNLLVDKQSNNSETNYRIKQMEKLLKNREFVDIDDKNNGLSITNLCLNEFSNDLKTLKEKFPKIKDYPKGIYCVTNTSEEVKPGVIFVLKCVKETSLKKDNLLFPYFIGYIDFDTKSIVTSIDKTNWLISIIKKLCNGIQKPIESLCNQFNQETKDGINMKLYSSLLDKVIKSISKKNKDSDIFNLIINGESNSSNSLPTNDDFELIDFIVIK